MQIETRRHGAAGDLLVGAWVFSSGSPTSWVKRPKRGVSSSTSLSMFGCHRHVERVLTNHKTFLLSPLNKGVLRTAFRTPKQLLLYNNHQAITFWCNLNKKKSLLYGDFWNFFSFRHALTSLLEGVSVGRFVRLSHASWTLGRFWRKRYRDYHYENLSLKERFKGK